MPIRRTRGGSQSRPRRSRSSCCGQVGGLSCWHETGHCGHTMFSFGIQEILRGRDIPGEEGLFEPSADDEYIPGLFGEGLNCQEWR